MKKIVTRYLLLFLLVCMMLFLSAGVSAEPFNATQTSIGQSGKQNLAVSPSVPKGWYTKKVRVGIEVKDLYAVGIQRIVAKAVQNGSWTDVTDTLYIDIADNCTVYVQATDLVGNITAKSIYVECFDRKKPNIDRASRNGRLLRIEASDDLSGVASIFVDDEECSDLNNGTLEFRLDTSNRKAEKVIIQAKDYAGNLSATYSIANPYYVNPDKKDSSSSPAPDALVENSGNSTTDRTLASSATTATQPPSSTATTH